MGHALKADEIESFRTMLQTLAARLRGDLNQMSDESIGSQFESSGNLSNVPTDVSDVGTEN